MHYISIQVVTGAVTDIVCWDSSEKYEECPAGDVESYRTVSGKCRVYIQSVFSVAVAAGVLSHTQSPLLDAYSLHFSAI
jgi:hypothetical protein